MDDDSRIQNVAKVGLGALGLGAIAAAVTIPKIGIWIALAIILLAAILFGGYFLWQRSRSRRQREQFTSAIEAQTSAAPKAISDPNQRASLDKVRQKFQTGLHEFKTRGKDIYKLPWYVIIGESGSGKTEAIRHSGIDFPPGLQDELQGSGGTVNMDWWFTNRGIILDTAGSMIFNEARAGETPEWREFLRLLKRARPHCPVNGLFLVLSIESLIRDSADKIAQKASVLAQQLDMIQRTLDVRFPVYLLVTKSDLLTGFREFFDNIEDPLLQHQIFGWSNPDPLDSPFRPDLVEQHLKSMADRVRRRRLALLRDVSAAGRLGDTSQFFSPSYQLGKGPAAGRRLDEVDSMFALPESILRLAPRLRRYLETIFVAGEWSAKPVFLRGIYFTSSMREGKALDEAIAFATGLSLDQLPEDRLWEKNRAFFLRDLFHEKVFRETGLVTRATNTLSMLRQRQVTIFGTAGGALLLLLVFATFAFHNLKKSVLTEASYWNAGATNWNQGVWQPIVTPGNSFRFTYGGTNLVPGTDRLTIAQYHQRLWELAAKPLSVSWIFKPMAWVNAGSVRERPKAQRLLFEASVIRPLVLQTRSKLIQADAPTGGDDALARHRQALLALMEIEADALKSGHSIGGTNAAAKYLAIFLGYLTDGAALPDPTLAGVFAATFSEGALNKSDGVWPPKDLSGGSSLEMNRGILVGLEKFHAASVKAQTYINEHLQLVNDLADRFTNYHRLEFAFTNSPDPCAFFNQTLVPARAALDASWRAVQTATNFHAGPLTSLSGRYEALANAASAASASVLVTPVTAIQLRLPESQQGRGLFAEIKAKLNELAGEAATPVRDSLGRRMRDVELVDADCLVLASTNGTTLAYDARWQLYQGACALASHPLLAEDSLVGDGWTRFGELKRTAETLRTNLASYSGPMAGPVFATCDRIAADAEKKLRNDFVKSYVALVLKKMSELEDQRPWTIDTVTNARNWYVRIDRDLKADAVLGEQQAQLAQLADASKNSRANVLKSIDADLRREIGFPVLLNSTRAMDLQGLRSVRQLATGLTTELQNAAWQGCDGLASLQANCRRYSSVVSALANDQGDPVEWELWFVPPDPANQDDRTISTVFPFAVGSLGKTQFASDNLTRAAATSLAKGTVDSAARISFRRYREDASSEEKVADVPNWAPIRMIRDFKAESRDEGRTWRFQIRVTDSRQNISGNMTFEARIKGSLPKLDDWPKQ